MEAGPARHVGRHINVPAVQIYHGIPRRGSAWGRNIKLHIKINFKKSRITKKRGKVLHIGYI